MEREIKKLSVINRKMKRLNKKRNKVHKRMCKIHTKTCREDRKRFSHNIQISKLPHLLIKKRSAPIEPLQEIVVFRDIVFQLDEIFSLILSYLGPMEFFIFSRTSKRLFALLNTSFYRWSTQFLERIGKETEIVFFPRDLKRDYMPLIDRIYQHKFIKTEQFLYHFLRLMYSIFVIYRPQGKANLVYITKASEIVLLHERTTIFIDNYTENKIMRLSEYNLLCGKSYYKILRDNIHYIFKQKYGLILEPTGNSLDYFSYKDLNAVNLSPISTKTAASNQALFFMTIDEKEVDIIPLDDKATLIFAMSIPSKSKWIGHYFCDEYECRLSRMNKLLPFIAPNIIIKKIETLISVL